MLLSITQLPRRVAATAIAFCSLLISLPALAIEFPPEQYVSGTLPVLYITTEDSVPITSKTDYVRAIWYLEDMDVEGVESIGNVDEQQGMYIKGRGNTSWKRDKKPYRIKLDEKVPLLGMKANRHFVLLSEWPDGNGRVNWEIGFHVSRLLGLPWTPNHQPVELVLNGEYLGLYFLAEKIRVDSDRVDITEQAEGETIPDLITGGWLCEIDNYVDAPQVKLTDRTTGKVLRTTVHNPEVLSRQQKTYITNFITAADEAIYCPDKTSTEWERYIDLEMLVRYYLTCEIVYQIECFSGSCYWSKDRGPDTKICFGPVWDFDTSNGKWRQQMFCYEQQPTDGVKDRNHWISELAKYPRFQQRVRELWSECHDTVMATVGPHAWEWVSRLAAAHHKDVERWYDYLHSYSDVYERCASYLRHFNTHQAWLDEQWSQPIPVIGDANGDGVVDDTDVQQLLRRLLGQETDTLAVGANTYDDEVIDLSDLVGVLRRIYAAEHPDTPLPYPTVAPLGQSYKDPDITIRPALAGVGDTLRLAADMERQAKLCFAGAPASCTAAQMDIAVSGLTISGIALSDDLSDSHQMHITPLGSDTLRIIVTSDSLSTFDGSTPIITFSLKGAPATSESKLRCALSISNIRLAERSMTPHYLEDASLPATWWRTPIRGDVNLDGVVDIADLNTAMNIITRHVPLEQFPYADLSHRGMVDVDDANDLINIMLRKDTHTTIRVKGVTFNMVRVMGGTFDMGATPEQGSATDANEKPVHQVTLTGYHIGQTEVTQALWMAVMGTNPSRFQGDEQRPVEMVSWNDCQEFIAKLNELTGLTFRLPTEAEWEYAARGGELSKGYTYAGGNSSKVVAWRNVNSDSTTHAVAQKEPNELGLYDMSGNVLEWCADWYGPYSDTPQKSPTGPASGTTRVCRGGCWKYTPARCRVAARNSKQPAWVSDRYGLRLAM